MYTDLDALVLDGVGCEVWRAPVLFGDRGNKRLETIYDVGVREADRVYAHLRKRILSLDLAPGSVLDEAGIVQDIGASRTPVREAVIRLVSEGLLKRDGRQIVVPTFQVGQLRAFFEALTLLARATHRMAAERWREPELAAIHDAKVAFEAATKCGDEGLMNEANYAFHRAISQAADNVFIQDAYETILLQSLRLSRHCFIAGGNSEYSHREHIEQIVRDHANLHSAITRRDPDEADRLAAAHIDLFRNWLGTQLLGPPLQVAEMALTP